MVKNGSVKSWRRGISLLLAFVMLMSCVNIEAFAQEYADKGFVEDAGFRDEEAARDSIEENAFVSPDDAVQDEELFFEEFAEEEQPILEEMVPDKPAFAQPEPEQFPASPAENGDTEEDEEAAPGDTEENKEETSIYDLSESETFDAGEVWYSLGNWRELQEVLDSLNGKRLKLGGPVTATADDKPLLLTNCSGLDLNGYTLDGSALDADYVLELNNASIYSQHGSIVGGRVCNVKVTGNNYCSVTGVHFEHPEVGMVIDGGALVRFHYLYSNPEMNILRVNNGTIILRDGPAIRERIELSNHASISVESKLYGNYNLAVEEPPDKPDWWKVLSQGDFTASADQFTICGTYDSKTGAFTESDCYYCRLSNAGQLEVTKCYEARLFFAYPESGNDEYAIEYVSPKGTYTLPGGDILMAPDGKVFKCWKQKGTDTELQPGKTFENVRSNLEFEAVWTITSGTELQKRIYTANDGETITLEFDYDSAREGHLIIAGGKNLTIDLNGHVIERISYMSGIPGNILTVPSGSTLTIIDSSKEQSGMILGGNNYYDGGAIIVQGTLNLVGGSIVGSKSLGNGGGIFVASGGTLNMSGGIVAANEAKNGGGIFLADGAVFTFTGGKIYSNTAAGSGGGIYACAASTLKMSRGPEVTDNYIVTNPDTEQETYTPSDVALTSGVKITVNGSFTDDAYIGLDTAADVVAAVGYTQADSADTYFFADNGGTPYSRNGAILVEIEHHFLQQPVWTWRDGAAKAEIHCQSCHEVLWTEDAVISGPVFNSEQQKLEYTATVTHDGKTYTDTHRIGGTLTSHARVEPRIDDEGAYIPGTEAYYSFEGEDNKTWLLAAAEDGSVGAVTGTVRPVMYFSFRGNVITGYTGGFETSTNLVLPKTYDGNALTQIGDGEHALFDNPAGMAVTVTVTENTQRVAANAFKGLSSLKTFGGSTSNLTEIGADAFIGSGVTELTLSAERKISIADSAFAGNVRISALHASALGEGEDTHGGRYTVVYTDHEYAIKNTNWDSVPPTITVRCVKPGCGKEQIIQATVTEQTEGNQTVKTAKATFEGIEYTHKDNVYQVTLKAGLGGGSDKTVPVTGSSYTLPAAADGFAAPAGAVIKGWQDQDGTDYAPGESCTLSGDKVFVAQWESTWAEVSKALEAGQAFKLLNSITAADDEGSLKIPANKTASLNLDGYTLDRGLAEAGAKDDGCVFSLGERSTLNLFGNGGAVTGGNNTGNGGGFYLGTSSTLLVANISISGNTSAAKGGAAYIDDGAKVSTNSNSSIYWGVGLGLGAVGGLVYFVGNKALKGGGTYIGQGGTLEIGNGVEILDNTNPSSGSEVSYDNVESYEGENGGGQQGSGSGSGGGGNGAPIAFVAGAGAGGAASSIGVSSATLAKLALGGLITLGLGFGIKFIVDRKSKNDPESTPTNPGEQQKTEQKNCKHEEYVVQTWVWDEATYESATMTAACKKCGTTITEKVNSTAMLEEETQTWKYTVTKYGSSETKEVAPYKVTLHSGLDKIIETLQAAADNDAAKAILEELQKIPAEEPRSVVQNVPHKQGQPGSLQRPDMPGGVWGTLVRFYRFGGWKPFDKARIFQDGKLRIEIKDDLDLSSDWECTVEYKKTTTAADEDPEKGITPITEAVPFGEVHVLRMNPFKRDYYDFDGWRVSMGGVAINKPANADPNAAKKGLAEGTPVAILANTEVTAQWRSKWSKLRDKMLTPSLMGTEVLAGPVKAMRGDSSLRLVASDFGIDLKGSTIDRSLGLGVGATTEVIGGNVFEVIAGTLTIMDSASKKEQHGGVVNGSAIGFNGGAVCVMESGRFVLNGGSILNNKAVLSATSVGGQGGGVYTGSFDGAFDRNVPMFFFKAGMIEENMATCGGGVYVGHKTNTLMTGGTITANEAAGVASFLGKGGGVYVDSEALFQMKGGTINGNHATDQGGGVYVAGDMEISGKINITGNRAGTMKACNVYLCKDKVLTVTGKLDQSTLIGVTTEVAPTADKPVVFTKGLKDNAEVINFTSDNDAYIVHINEQGEAELCLPAAISFDANGGTGNMGSEKIMRNEQYMLPDCRFTAPAGKGFTGWNISVGGQTTATGKQPGDLVTITGDATVTAQWAEQLTVTFDTDGGSAVAAQTVFVGKTAAEPEMPTKQGYTFIRWELNGEEFSFYTPVNRNLTLKARWAEGTVPVFRTHSLALGERIAINFFMDLPTIEGVDYSKSEMIFTIGGIDSSRIHTAAYNPNFKSQNGKYYGFTCMINVAEMADTVTAAFHYGDDRTVSQIYSVAHYVEKIKTGPEYVGKVKAMVDALADFGHYMQPFLSEANQWTLGENGKHRVMPEENKITAEQIAEIKNKTADYDMVKNITEGSPIINVKQALVLDSETSIYLHLEMRDDYAGGIPTAKIGNKSLKVTRMSDGRYRVVIPSIRATQLGDKYEVVITADGKDCTVSVSALSYVYKALANPDNLSPSAQAAVASLYRYYDAARQYNAR